MDSEKLSSLPDELKAKIAFRANREVNSTKVIEKLIQASCRKYEEVIKKEDASMEEIKLLGEFLVNTADYYQHLLNKPCLIIWKKEVPMKIKFEVIMIQHMKVYGPIIDPDLGCYELFYPDYEDDLCYAEGEVYNFNNLMFMLDDEYPIVKIVIGPGKIETPSPETVTTQDTHEQ